MSKNSVLFIIFLAFLTILVGYSKYVLVPTYQAQHSLPSPTISPSPISMGDAIQTAEQGSPFGALTDSQKLRQFLALTVPVPVATNSAQIKLVVENEPGFITLTGQYTATPSAKKTMAIVTQNLATKSAVPVLFAVKKTAALPTLCALDTKCLSLLPKEENLFSSPIIAASASGSLTKQALAEFQRGKVILNLSQSVSQAQLDGLITDLVAEYKKDNVFKQIIDGNLEAILKIKQGAQ